MTTLADIDSPLCEVEFRLSEAAKAFDGFMALLSGYHDSRALEAVQMFALLQPIQVEVDAALLELHKVPKGVEHEK